MPRKRRQPPEPDCANEEHIRKYVNKVNEYTAERIQSTSKSLGVSETLMASTRRLRYKLFFSIVPGQRRILHNVKL